MTVIFELPKPEQAPRWLKNTMTASYIASLGILGYGTFTVTYAFREIHREGQQRKYELSHLAPNAVTSEENPYLKLVSSDVQFVYLDRFGNGQYHSVLQRINSDGKTVDIFMEKNLEGKIQFMNLSSTALNPLVNPSQCRIDYMDVDGNGTLESVTSLEIDQHKKLIRLEYKNNDIILTPLKDK